MPLLVLTGAATAHDERGEVVPIKLLFDPAFSQGVPAQGSGGGAGNTQSGQEWDGTADGADPFGLTGAADVREFAVNAGNDLMKLAISWDPGLELSYDLDLYVEWLEEPGHWTLVGLSTGGQLLGEGEAKEVVELQDPVPGSYRTRVVNFASETFDYHGSISFASEKGGGGKPARGRATADRPDAAQGSQLHVIYFVPSDGNDNALDTNGVLENAVASMNLWLDGQAGSRHLRLDTYLDRNKPRLDISFVQGKLTAADYAASDAFGAITDELEERGWTANPGLKRYLVYYEGPAEDENICGTAFYNTLDTGFAQWSVVFLGAIEGCGARDFGTPSTGAGMSEAIALQELVHNEGIVRPQAPHHCLAGPGHVCTAGVGAVSERFSFSRGLDPESVDVMFPFVTVALSGKALDLGHDDYFDHPFLHRDLSNSPFLTPGG